MSSHATDPMDTEMGDHAPADKGKGKAPEHLEEEEEEDSSDEEVADEHVSLLNLLCQLSSPKLSC